MADQPLDHNELEKELLKSKLQTVSDNNDLYDYQWVQLNENLIPIQRKWMGRPNNRKNLEELEKEIVDACLKAGVVARVHTGEVLLGISPFPVVEPIGRIDIGHDGEFDHELKKTEVRLSRIKNEMEHGMKERKKKRA